MSSLGISGEAGDVETFPGRAKVGGGVFRSLKQQKTERGFAGGGAGPGWGHDKTSRFVLFPTVNYKPAFLNFLSQNNVIHSIPK